MKAAVLAVLLAFPAIAQRTDDPNAVIGRSFPVSESVISQCRPDGGGSPYCASIVDLLACIAEEPRDLRWAPEAEAHLHEWLSRFPDATVRAVECRTSLCAVETSSLKGALNRPPYADPIRDFLDPWHAMRGYETNASSARVTVTLGFLMRSNTTRPQFRPVPPPGWTPPPRPPDDDDRDGVTNDKDRCPNTSFGSDVDMRGCWREFSLLHGLKFETNSSKLSAAARKDLGVVIEAYKELPPDVAAGVKINVEGYTDSTGEDAYNKGLSERRARSAGGYLTKNGIPASIVSATGFGEANPVDSNDTGAGRATNRRVLIRVTRKCALHGAPP